MKLNSQSGATDKITRGVEKKIAKPKKDEKVPRKAVRRSEEGLEMENRWREMRAQIRANAKRIDEINEQLKENARRMQQLRQAMAAAAAAASAAEADDLSSSLVPANSDTDDTTKPNCHEILSNIYRYLWQFYFQDLIYFYRFYS
ncbi:hypothetical protein PRIPAC_85841 [Pristionchus pacificus]|uniref:Uncharacterized protein n=1 Tax=Pristionchus pacificus TaxID=54126 RepID=A0A2A6BMG4_PRIPA|nr:hypothetical protein PRIPAC_85841 [Pristionchus pacificus]|eukprot:PDM66996.1 hypothetical protein PRIPAC_48413 [Pristionchus pacificus]